MATVKAPSPTSTEQKEPKTIPYISYNGRRRVRAKGIESYKAIVIPRRLKMIRVRMEDGSIKHYEQIIDSLLQAKK
jgi:hypothetical protein